MANTYFYAAAANLVAVNALINKRIEVQDHHNTSKMFVLIFTLWVSIMIILIHNPVLRSIFGHMISFPFDILFYPII